MYAFLIWLAAALPINSRVTEGKTFKPAVEPKNKLRVDVYRYNPDLNSNPYLDTYILDKNDFGPMGLDVLLYIKNNIEDIQPSNNTGVSNLETPVHLKYRSDRINNGRAYLLLGGNFMLDMSSVERLTQQQNLKFKKINFISLIFINFD